MTTRRWRPHPGARFRVARGEAVVIQQRTGEFLSLNEVGTRILELAAGSLTRGEILDHLLEEFEIDRATLADDTDRFLAELTNAGILEAVTESP